jgi:hypothetical protein
MRSPSCLCVCVTPPPPINFWMPEPICMKIGIYSYIMTTEPISTVYFTNPSHQSVCLYVYLSSRRKATAPLSVSLISVLSNGSVNTFPRQQIHATIEEFLDACVCGSVSVSLYRLLGNIWEKMFPRQRRIVGGVVFYAVRVVSNQSRLLILPRTSCNNILPLLSRSFQWSLCIRISNQNTTHS